jgi:site-specific DNA-methyltransferase (adenine-specific)
MSLYYEDEYVQLHHGDCRAIRGWTTADVLVTDPPYGISFRSGMSPRHRFDPIAGDHSTDVRDEVLGMWGNRPALVFGRWDQQRPQGTRTRLIWDKVNQGMGNLSLPWAPTDEEIYVIGEWPPISPGGRRREGGTPARHSNVLRAATMNSQATDRPDHPTPKPVGLMEALIEKCPPGVIADPFAGSGATLIAARNLGRKAIGVELEEKYCELIVRRLSQQAFDFSSLEAS